MSEKDVIKVLEEEFEKYRKFAEKKENEGEPLDVMECLANLRVDLKQKLKSEED